MTPTRPSLTGHQAKGGYLQPNSVTGLHPCVSPHTHPRAEDGAPRHPRQGSGPSLTEPSPTPPRPPRSNAASRRGAGSEAPEAAERGPAAAGPGPALTLTGRRLRQGRARLGSPQGRSRPGPCGSMATPPRSSSHPCRAGTPSAAGCGPLPLGSPSRCHPDRAARPGPDRRPPPLRGRQRGWPRRKPARPAPLCPAGAGQRQPPAVMWRALPGGNGLSRSAAPLPAGPRRPSLVRAAAAAARPSAARRRPLPPSGRAVCLSVCLSDWLTDWLSDWTDWPTDWLDWLTDWLDWLADWLAGLTDWLDWLTDRKLGCGWPVAAVLGKVPLI